jgi:hypothetical protein
MFLSQTAAEVSLLVRGSDLRNMSSYLSGRLPANSRVRIRYRTEVVGVEGVEHICGLHRREPNGEIHEEGFLLTGPEVALLSARKEPRPRCTVETSLPPCSRQVIAAVAQPSGPPSPKATVAAKVSRSAAR